MNEIVFRNDNGMAVTSSYLVAKTFGKEHFHVVRDVETLTGKLQNIDYQCNPNLEGCNAMFEEYTQEVSVANGGAKQAKAYFMNRDGFTLLVMGYTGQKALEFKLKYIAAFNRMEQELKSGSIQKLRAENDKLRTDLNLACEIIQLKDENFQLQRRVDDLTRKNDPHDQDWLTMKMAMDPTCTLEPVRLKFLDFMRRLLGNGNNVGCPVALRELLITWLMENEVPVNKRNIKRFYPLFRRSLLYYCDQEEVEVNPYHLFETDYEKKEKAFFRKHPQTLFQGDSMVYPRQRPLLGRERCWVFYPKGFRVPKEGPLMAAAKHNTALLPNYFG